MTDPTASGDQVEDRPNSKKAIFLLGAALVLLLIPVVIGWRMANTDDEGNAESSGMAGSNMGGGSSEEIGVDVRPIDEILDGPIAVEVDPSGTAAVLRLDTTIDVACSVVYGTTTNFGGLATDTDMAGGGHRNHQPVMTGLEPDSTVLYRVQGTGPDGTIYVGEVEQFTTGGDASGPRPINLSLEGSIVEVSSEFNSSFGAGNAIDGSLASEWSSRGDGNQAFIVIDLGVTADVTGFGFRTREMSDGTSITNAYTVTVDAGDTLGPFEAGLGLSVSQVEVTGQVFRFDLVDTTGGNTGAVEIEIYGS